MWITLSYLLFLGLLGASVGAMSSWWLGGLLASVGLIAALLLEAFLRIPLRLGRWPLVSLLPFLWIGLLVGTGIYEARQATVMTRKAAAPPMRAPLEASAFVDRTTLRVEQDRLRYTLTLRYPKTLKPEIPKITAHPTFHSALLMPADAPPKISESTDDKGILTRRWELTLMPVATGPLDTPRFTIRYNEGGKTHKVIIPSIALDVTESAKPDTLLASLRAAKAVVLPERPESAIPWPLVGSASGGLLALFLLGLWLRKRSLRPPPPIPPHEWFQQAWDALQAQGLLEKEQEKAHYYALSEIFRGYLERRFDFPALESTSEEIIAWAKEQEELDQEIYRDIRRLLQWMDGIKFAGTRSTPEEREEMDRRLHSVVRRTPQPDAQGSQEEAPQDAA